MDIHPHLFRRENNSHTLLRARTLTSCEVATTPYSLLTPRSNDNATGCTTTYHIYTQGHLQRQQRLKSRKVDHGTCRH